MSNNDYSNEEVKLSTPQQKKQLTFGERIAKLAEYAASEDAFACGILSASAKLEYTNGKTLYARCASKCQNSICAKRAIIAIAHAMQLSPSAISSISHCMDRGRVYITARIICED